MKNRIEKYLANKMIQQEKIDFELEMVEDPHLGAEVLRTQMALHAIRLEGRSELKKKLIALDGISDTPNSKEKKGIGFKSPLLYFFFFFLVAAFLWMLLKKDEPLIDCSSNVESNVEENLQQNSAISHLENAASTNSPHQLLRER